MLHTSGHFSELEESKGPRLRKPLEAILVALNRYMMPLADDPQLCSATSFDFPAPESKAGSEQEVIVL